VIVVNDYIVVNVSLCSLDVVPYLYFYLRAILFSKMYL
jgi:hypothetical protein